MTVTTFTDEVDITLTPPTGVTPGLVIKQSLTGTTAISQYGANRITIDSDDVTGAATTSALKLNHSYGGGSGAKAVIESVGFLTAPTSNTVAHGNYIGLLGTSQLMSGDGGTPGSEKGIGIGVLGSAGTGPSSQNIFSAVGVQGDVGSISGSTLRTRIGVQAIDDNGEVQGGTYDSAFGVSAVVPSVGWKHALLIGKQGDYTSSGSSPMNTNATLIATQGCGDRDGYRLVLLRVFRQ